jgi:hypothetical protein
MLCLALSLMAGSGCSQTLPEEGPLHGTSAKVAVAGEYKRVNIDAVERVSIDGDKLVLHNGSSSVAVALPPSADPSQKNRGWALVTEGEGDATRALTFTHEMSLEDFTITVPAAEGQVAYGSLGGRDGKDVLLFAYGSHSKAYWGWVTISKK